MHFLDAAPRLAREAAQHVIACGDEWEPAIAWIRGIVRDAPAWKRAAFLDAVARQVAVHGEADSIAAAARLFMMSVEAEFADRAEA